MIEWFELLGKGAEARRKIVSSNPGFGHPATGKLSLSIQQ